MMRTVLILIGLAGLVVQADAQRSFTKADLDRLGWLEGAWKGKTQNSVFYEAWHRVNDSTMVNLGIEVMGGDTVIREASALVLRAGKLLRKGDSFDWTATRAVASELVLRNDTARFSNTIIWMHTPEDHWWTILEHPRSSVSYDIVRDEPLTRKVNEWIAENKRRRQ